jgi:hypothetical protein
MIRIITFAFSAALALVSVPASAQNTRSLDGGVSPPATIDKLAWVAGSWVGSGMGEQVTETYSAPLGGRITGHFVMSDGKGGVSFTEIVDYIPVGGSLAYRVRHFDPDMKGWEDQTRKPVVFALVAVENNRWYFDGMTLERTGPDTLTIWVRIENEGAAQEVPFRLTRSSPALP